MNQSPSQNTSQVSSTATYVSALRIESVRSNAGAFLDHPMFMFLAEQLYAMEEQYQNLCKDHYDALRLCDSYREDLHRANERIVLEQSRVDELEMSWEMLFDQYNEKFDELQEVEWQLQSLLHTCKRNARKPISSALEEPLATLARMAAIDARNFRGSLNHTVIDLTTESDTDNEQLLDEDIE